MNAFLSAGLKVELADTDKNGIIVPQEEDELQKIECHVGLFGAPTTQVESDNGVAVLKQQRCYRRRSTTLVDSRRQHRHCNGN